MGLISRVSSRTYRNNIKLSNMLTRLAQTSNRTLFNKLKGSSVPASNQFNMVSKTSFIGIGSFAVWYYAAFWRPDVAKEYEEKTGKHDDRSLFQILSGR